MVEEMNGLTHEVLITLCAGEELIIGRKIIELPVFLLMCWWVRRKTG